MEHLLMHWSSTLSPGDLATTLRNLVLGTALLVFFALPAVFVLYSRKVAGKARLAWFAATLFLSWPAYAVFAIFNRARPAGQSDDLSPPRAHCG